MKSVIRGGIISVASFYKKAQMDVIKTTYTNSQIINVDNIEFFLELIVFSKPPLVATKPTG